MLLLHACFDMYQVNGSDTYLWPLPFLMCFLWPSPFPMYFQVYLRGEMSFSLGPSHFQVFNSTDTLVTLSDFFFWCSLCDLHLLFFAGVPWEWHILHPLWPSPCVYCMCPCLTLSDLPLVYFAAIPRQAVTRLSPCLTFTFSVVFLMTFTLSIFHPVWHWPSVFCRCTVEITCPSPCLNFTLCILQVSFTPWPWPCVFCLCTVAVARP